MGGSTDQSAVLGRTERAQRTGAVRRGARRAGRQRMEQRDSHDVGLRCCSFAFSWCAPLRAWGLLASCYHIIMYIVVNNIASIIATRHSTDYNLHTSYQLLTANQHRKMPLPIIINHKPAHS